MVRWVFILLLLEFGGLFVFFRTILVLFPSTNESRVFADIVVSYFGGLPVLMLLYRYLVERGFRKAWKLEHPIVSLSDGTMK